MGAAASYAPSILPLRSWRASRRFLIAERLSPGDDSHCVPGKRVLVVDDNPDLLESLGILVMDIGYDVETAAGGVEALSKVDQGKFDLVLTDFRMPGMDGAQLTEEIKKRRREVKVVMITGSPSERVSLSSSGSLKKPFSLSELRNVIKDCLR